MKKRFAVILIPSVLFIGIVTALILSQFSNRLPTEAEYVLNAYLEAVHGQVMLTTVVYAWDSEQFTAEMGRAILHAPIEEYRTSPVLYDGDIIRPVEETNQFAFPAQELWCVALNRQDQANEYFFLARHENLYGSTWVLYQSVNGAPVTETVGCNPL